MKDASLTIATKNGEAATLPKGWQRVPLREICERIDYGFTASADFSIKEPRFLRITDVQDGGVEWASVPGCKISEIEVQENRLDDGDIVFARTGATTGKSFLVRNPPKAVFASYLIRLRLASEVLPEFLALFLQSDDYWKQIRAQARGGIQPNFNATMLGALSVLLPPLVEQRRIAARLREQLAAVSQVRAAVQAQVDAAQALPAAHLRAVFNSPAAPRWSVAKLGEVAEITGGIQKTPDRAPRQFHKQFLTVRNVQRGYLDLTRVERFEVTAAEFARCRLERGDILIVEGNGSADHIGRNALFDQDGEWIHQNHVIRVRMPADRFVPEFVSLFLNSDEGRRQMLDKAKTTTGLYTLSTSKVATLEIPAAPISDQRIVSAKLGAEKKEAASLTRTLTEKLIALDHLPPALLREAFNGNG